MVGSCSPVNPPPSAAAPAGSAVIVDPGSSPTRPCCRGSQGTRLAGRISSSPPPPPPRLGRLSSRGTAPAPRRAWRLQLKTLFLIMAMCCVQLLAVCCVQLSAVYCVQHFLAPHAKIQPLRNRVSSSGTPGRIQLETLDCALCCPLCSVLCPALPGTVHQAPAAEEYGIVGCALRLAPHYVERRGHIIPGVVTAMGWHQRRGTAPRPRSGALVGGQEGVHVVFLAPAVRVGCRLGLEGIRSDVWVHHCRHPGRHEARHCSGVHCS